MPLIRISIRSGKAPTYRAALVRGVYEALRETFGVPEDDLFATVTEHDDANFAYGETYLDIRRTDDLAIVQITVSNTRTVEQKRALYAAIAERLARDPGMRPEDVFINLVEVAKENWSFGNGIAQYA